MSWEEKFKAAVNVIRSLPKNGAYQPSHDLMLRFYAYYKQAVEGPNTGPKPAFWEVIKKAKWDAWTRLGNMSRGEAMRSYVEELNKIVETMAYTDNVANFLTSLDSFYENVPQGDLELLMGPVIEKVRSQPGSPLSSSPLGSREASPHRVQPSLINGNVSNHLTSCLEVSPTSSYSASPLPPETDEEEDFLDTLEQTEPEVRGKGSESKKKVQMNGAAIMPKESALPNGHAEPVASSTERSRAREKRSKEGSSSPSVRRKTVVGEVPSDTHVIEVMRQAVALLRRDMDSLQSRLEAIESTRSTLHSQLSVSRSRVRPPRWWPFKGVSVSSGLLLILWPIALQCLVLYIQRRRNRSL